MTGNNKTPRLKHRLTTEDKERLHMLLRIRMIACGRREQVNRLVRGARKDSKVLSREELKNKITPKARAVVPELIMDEIMREMELCHGPRVIEDRPRAERIHAQQIDRIDPPREYPQILLRVPQYDRNVRGIQRPRIERNALRLRVAQE